MTALFFNNCNPHLTDIALGYIPALGSSIGLMALDTRRRLWGTPAGRLSILCSHYFKELETFVFWFADVKVKRFFRDNLTFRKKFRDNLEYLF